MTKEKIMILLGKLMFVLNGTELLTEVTDALNELLEYKQMDNTNSSEALECLEVLKSCADVCGDYSHRVEPIKQALLKSQEQEKENAEYKKVLEIIKNKNVDILDIKIYTNYEHYCRAKEDSKLRKDWWLTEEEFDLLKRYTDER